MTAERNPGETSGNRLPALDGLRGGAALSVVGYHMTLILPDAGGWKNWPVAGVLWNGHEAVYIFFVISGLVLSLPYHARRHEGYAAFAMRRVLRIYPAYGAAILVAVLLAVATGPHLLWQPPLTLSAIGCDLLMLDRPDDMELDSPIWSLVQEMRISLLFPLLIWLDRRIGALVVPILLVLAVAAAVASGSAGPTALSILKTVRLIWFFSMGIWIARHLPPLRAFTRGWSRPAQLALLLALLVVVSIDPHPNVAWLVIIFASGPLVAAAACLPVFATFLTTPPLRFLGRISYSLYLLHVPIIYAVMDGLERYLPIWLAIVPAILAAILAAMILERVVEQPFITLGRRFRAKRERAPPAAGSA